MRIALIGGNKGLGRELSSIWENQHDLIEINRETEPGFDMADPYDHPTFCSGSIDGFEEGAAEYLRKHLKEGNKYLRLDALVVCAGSGAFLPPVPKDEQIANMFAINTITPIKMYHAALKNLLKAQGKVIFITSTAARKPGSGGLSLYAASKGAINSFVVSEGRRAIKHGIGMCAVAPGYFESPMTEAIIPQIKKATLKNIPAGRYGKVEEIADFIDSLLHQSNWTIAGSVFELSGGA